MTTIGSPELTAWSGLSCFEEVLFRVVNMSEEDPKSEEFTLEGMKRGPMKLLGEAELGRDEEGAFLRIGLRGSLHLGNLHKAGEWYV